MALVEESRENPFRLLKSDSIPSAWCPGCGLGMAVNLFLFAIEQSGLEPDDLLLLSTDIGCTGKVSDYVSLPIHHDRGGHLVSSAVKRVANRKKGKCVLFLDDADYIATGVEHFIQAGVTKADIIVVYFNNYIYRIFMEHRQLNKSQVDGKPLRKDESPYNIPRLARLCGASFAARWTPYHPRRFSQSLIYGLLHPGLAVVEMISPCYMYYPNIGSFGETIDKMAIVRDRSVLRHMESVESFDLEANDKILVGEFIFDESP